MSAKTKLSIGTKFLYDGDSWTVEGFNGGNLQIRSARGNLTIIGIGALIGAPGFAFHARSKIEVGVQEDVTFPDNLRPEAIADAKTLLEHLNEVGRATSPATLQQR